MAKEAKMDSTSGWGKLKEDLKTFTLWTLSGLIDAIFLVIWVYVQWGTGRLIAGLELSYFDHSIFVTFQYLFAVSTLIPVASYIYVDLRIILIRAQKRIEQELSEAGD